MHTTVTGMFPNQQLATQAARSLVLAGIPEEQVRVVAAGTPARHEFIDTTTADTKRAVLLGATFGAIGGAIAGIALASVFGLVPGIVVGGLAAAAGGAALGLMVGRSTKSQVREELENQVSAGTVLVSVTADSSQEGVLLDLLEREKGRSLVSSAASFTAGVLPGTSP